MIPKIIHYCWFGRGEMPPIIKKCMKSWKKHCPDWKIICWNEDNFDVQSSAFTRQAYEAKKYAFVADYVRLKALYEMGGVYLDTDQELRKPLDPFLHHRAFAGFLNKYEVSAGVIGAEPGHELIREMLQAYSDKVFLSEKGEDLTPNTKGITGMLQERGLIIDDTYQEIGQIAIYPQTYFCPTSCITVEHCISKDTVSVHHWAGSWHTEKGRKDMKREKFHTTKFYRTWEKVKIFPQKALRNLLSDRVVDCLKERLGK